MKQVLVLGAGNQRYKRMSPQGAFDSEPRNEVITTIDIDPLSKPDVLHDLGNVPWPLHDNSYDEIHAYEILEHFGEQGDLYAFFTHFGELWRVLRSGGILFASVPRFDSVWAYGDPGHTRVISHASLAFLCRKNYEAQVGRTAMADYRRLLVGDWQVLLSKYYGDNYLFAMRTLK